MECVFVGIQPTSSSHQTDSCTDQLQPQIRRGNHRSITITDHVVCLFVSSSLLLLYIQVPETPASNLNLKNIQAVFYLHHQTPLWWGD